MQASPRERGFAIGLSGKAAENWPLSCTDAQIKEFHDGWVEGRDERDLRRKEAKRISKIGYHPMTVAVKERNGKITMLTLEQYARRAARLRRREI